MPMAGLTGSDLLQRFRTVQDPYSGEIWAAIQAIAPDWTILHVNEADEQGNMRIRGARYDDLLKAKAARNVLVTCERLVPVAEMAENPAQTDLPGFLVTAVVEAPRGAWPHGCADEYGYDEAFIRAYLASATADTAYGAFVERLVSPG